MSLLVDRNMPRKNEIQRKACQLDAVPKCRVHVQSDTALADVQSGSRCFSEAGRTFSKIDNDTLGAVDI
jgi:hypothetical protein